MSKVKSQQASFLTSSALSVLCIFLCAYFFRNEGRALFSLWEKEEYGHAFIVVPLGLYWIAAAVSKKDVKSAPSLLFGSFVLLAGLIVNVFGTFIVSTWLSHIAILGVLSGFILTALGSKALAASWKGLLLIALVIPLPPQFMTLATAQLQLVSSMFGTLILQILQIPVYREGNIIDLGDLKLQVVEACSGLNYVMPLLCFSFFVGFSFKLKGWVRGALLVSVLPIAVLANALRISLIGVTSTLWGREAAEGLLHDLEGYVFFFLCLLMLAGCFWCLLRLSGDRFTPDGSLEWQGGRCSLRKLLLPTGTLLAVLSLMLGASLAKTWLLDRRTSVETPYDISGFPLSIGPWQGSPRGLSLEELNVLNPSNYFMADYSFKSEHAQTGVNFYVAYYSNTQLYNAPHSPLVCLPGSGWEVKALESYSFTPKSARAPLTVNRILIAKGNATSLVYFWWKVGGHNVASTFSVKGRLFLDAMKSGRSDVALVRAVINVPRIQTAADQDAVLQGFVSDILQPLNNFIPSTDFESK